MGDGICGGGEDDAGLKPRGCAKYSPNLYKKGGGSVQTRRRSARGIQSQIQLFENLKQGEIRTESITNGELINHVGRGDRKRFSEEGLS